MMSDTPETDNLARGNHVVPTTFAEQLERERDRLAEALWAMLNEDDGSAIKAGILLRSLGLKSLTHNDL